MNPDQNNSNNNQVPAEPAQPAPYPPQPAMPVMPQQPSTMQPQAMPTQQAPAPAPHSRKPWLIVVIIAVVLIALGVGAYFWLKPSDRNATNDANSKSSAASTAKPLSELNSVSLIGPAAPTGYTKNDTGIATFTDYSRTTANGTSGCEFIFGTATAAQVPGTDIGDIVAKSLEPYRQEGDTIVGPQVSSALILKDSSDSKIQYSMPTLSYDITIAKTGGRLISHYSGVVLKNGDRAIVNRVCADKSGKVDTATLSTLDTLASTILVTAK